MIKKDYSSVEIELAKTVIMLQEKEAHPDGSFDKAKRWFPDVMTPSASAIRSPSRAWPFSLMAHCRTAKYQAQRAGLEPKRISKIVRLLKAS